MEVMTVRGRYPTSNKMKRWSISDEFNMRKQNIFDLPAVVSGMVETQIILDASPIKFPLILLFLVRQYQIFIHDLFTPFSSDGNIFI
jgi:hypothetical protein